MWCAQVRSPVICVPSLAVVYCVNSLWRIALYGAKDSACGLTSKIRRASGITWNLTGTYDFNSFLWSSQEHNIAHVCVFYNI